MNYNIEPIFVVFPLLCFVIHLTKYRSQKLFHVLLILLFLLIYSFSLNGSDIDGYRKHYAMVERGVTASENSQEIGYYYLMRLSIAIGLDYVGFRILLLSILSIVLFRTFRKFIDDFPLALFFVSSMFIIYTISAYRQFIVIAFSVFLLYEFSCGKKKKAIICTTILMLFHFTAVLPLGCMIYELYNTNIRIDRANEKYETNYLLIIIVALCVRLTITFLLRLDIINKVVGQLLGEHSTPDPTLFSFGLISRLLFLCFITYLYRISWTEDSKIKLLFWYYFISITIYIAIPLEFVMGRLMNNAHILSAVLIPMLSEDITFQDSYMDIGYNIKSVKRITFLLEMLAFVILINQLLKQNGYTPYLNVFFGDEIIDFSG